MLPPLAGLLPGGVRRGDAVAVRSRDQVCDYLTLALLAGVLGAGFWCAVVGVPELGGVALAELLADSPDPYGGSGLDRLLLAPEPGERWAQVVVALADGVDLVLVRPPGPVDAAVGRRVDARLRQGRGNTARHSAALLVLGSWPSARMVLHTEQTEWVGLDGSGVRAGTGHLRGGLATVVAQGRASGGQARMVRAWLPSADGTVRAVAEEGSVGAGDGTLRAGDGTLRAGEAVRATSPGVGAASGETDKVSGEGIGGAATTATAPPETAGAASPAGTANPEVGGEGRHLTVAA